MQTVLFVAVPKKTDWWKMVKRHKLHKPKAQTQSGIKRCSAQTQNWSGDNHNRMHNSSTEQRITRWSLLLTKHQDLSYKLGLWWTLKLFWLNLMYWIYLVFLLELLQFLEHKVHLFGGGERSDVSVEVLAVVLGVVVTLAAGVDPQTGLPHMAPPLTALLGCKKEWWGDVWAMGRENMQKIYQTLNLKLLIIFVSTRGQHTQVVNTTLTYHLLLYSVQLVGLTHPTVTEQQLHICRVMFLATWKYTVYVQNSNHSFLAPF